MTRTNRLLVAAAILAGTGIVAASLAMTEKGRAFLSSKPWIRNGDRIECYANGTPRFKQTRRNGKSDGLYTRWYPNGIKQQEIMFSNGIRSGKCESWHDNGTRSFSGQFTDGKYDGKWTFFDTNGTQIAETTCKDGKFWEGTDARYLNGILMLTTYENGQIVSSEKRRE